MTRRRCTPADRVAAATEAFGSRGEGSATTGDLDRIARIAAGQEIVCCYYFQTPDISMMAIKGGVRHDHRSAASAPGQHTRVARGDPGDAIWTALTAPGFAGLDYDGSEDLEFGRQRQAVLVARGEQLEVTYRRARRDGL
jgi:hypothetical protein